LLETEDKKYKPNRYKYPIYDIHCIVELLFYFFYPFLSFP